MLPERRVRHIRSSAATESWACYARPWTTRSKDTAGDDAGTGEPALASDTWLKAVEGYFSRLLSPYDPPTLQSQVLKELGEVSPALAASVMQEGMATDGTAVPFCLHLPNGQSSAAGWEYRLERLVRPSAYRIGKPSRRHMRKSIPVQLIKSVTKEHQRHRAYGFSSASGADD